MGGHEGVGIFATCYKRSRGIKFLKTMDHVVERQDVADRVGQLGQV